MKKLKNLKEDLANLNKVFEIALGQITTQRIQIQTLEIEIAKLRQPFLRCIKKEDYKADKLWYVHRLDEMESKLSMKFYQNVGIYEKIRMEFASQLISLKKDMVKLQENVQILLQKM